MAKQFNITWQSQPVFDTWGWADYWSQDDWKTWMDRLIEHYGKPQGVDVWYKAWSSRTGTWETLGDVRGDWIAFGNSFRNWLKEYKLSNGINLLDAILDSVVLGSVFAGADDLADDAGKGLSNAGDTLSTTTKTLQWVIPVLIVLAAIAIVFFGYKFLKLKTS